MSRKYLIVPALVAMCVIAASSGAAVTPMAELRLGDAYVVEGDSGTKSVRVPLELSSTAQQFVQVKADTQAGTATTADYTTVSTWLLIDEGQDRTYVDVPIKGDALREGLETFSVKLSQVPSHVRLADDVATVRIGDNEQPIAVSADDVAVTEGNTGTKNLTFTVALSRALGSGQTAQVAYATRNVTAAATDYTAKSGTLTFSGTGTTQTVAVPITADKTTEPNETFELTLSSTSTVVGVVDGAALGTIVNDDGTAGATPLPALRVDDPSLVEPATGDANLRYRVWLSAAATKATSVEILTDAAAGTATAGADYVAQTARRVNIAIGATQVLVDVPVHADTTFEAPEERVALTLRSPTNAVLADTQGVGTIVDEEGPLRAWVTDAAIDEGDSGDRVANPEVVVAAPLAAGRTFDFTYATEDGDAKVPSDYASATGTSKLDSTTGPKRALSVSLHGDVTGEADEKLGVRVSSATPGIVLEDPVGTVTIGNDDIVPTPDASPTILGDYYDTGTITTSSGVWSGDQPITLSRRWERCTPAGVCTAIAGATGASYVFTTADVGSGVRVSVTATNPAGTTTASSPVSTVVAPKPRRGEAEKGAAVQALIRGSIFTGECSARCQALVDREVASTDPQAAQEMADLRDALGLFGAREAPRPGAYASRAKARTAQAASDPRHWMERIAPRISRLPLTQNGLAVLKVRSQGSYFYWLWTTPQPSSPLVDLGEGSDPNWRSRVSVSWVNWHVQGELGYGDFKFPRTAWYAGYTSASQPFRWLDSIHKDANGRPIPVCDGSYTVRPLDAVPGFGAVQWIGPSAPPQPDIGFEGCESRNGSLLTDQVGPLGPMRPWRTDDPYPQVEFSLDSLDPTPDPPDPPELESEICRHLVSGQYPNANRLLTFPCDEELALMFRPSMRFDASERWRPLEISNFLHERLNGAPLHEVCDHPGIPGCKPLLSDSQLDGAAQDTYLKINAANTAKPPGDPEHYKSPTLTGCMIPELDLWDCDYGSKSAMYYNASDTTAKGYRYFDYWAFYRANIFGTLPVANQHNHQGDWEGVSIAPSKSRWGTFDFAAFSQHTGPWMSYLRYNLRCTTAGPGAYRDCGTDASPLGARVLSYVAHGSHANYPAACSENLTEQCFQEDSAVDGTDIALPERGHDGKNTWGNDAEESALLPMPNGLNSGLYDWSHWIGNWGTPEGAITHWGSAPSSPGRQNHSWVPDDNKCALDNEDCPLEATTARAHHGKRAKPRPRRPRVNRRLRECRTWFGSGVQVLACTPKRLKRGLRAQRLNRSGTLRILAPQRGGARIARQALRRARAETAPGLAQRLGAPLKLGTSLRLEGRVPAGTRLLVRLVRRHRVYAAAFVVPRGARGAVLRAGGRSAATLRLDGGAVLRPRSVRRATP